MMDDTSQNRSPVDYDLTCWYLNKRRVLELLGSELVLAGGLPIASSVDESLRELATLAAFKRATTHWLRVANPPTLGQLLLSHTLGTTGIFTHFGTLICRGLPQVHQALAKGKVPLMAEAYAKVDEFGPGLKVTFRFSHEHLTSASSWSELSGQKRLFVLGAVTAISDSLIEAIPWVIASPFPDLSEPTTAVGAHWRTHLETFVDSIDSFERIRGQAPPRSRSDLEILRAVPEAGIKRAFAEILGEAIVPKDWGGERSDLFTTRVVIGGKRISSAFAFKGPARFTPMTLADLGKNGDQIDRLYTEPADLLVLQHCHEITPPVRATMRAYAQRMGNLRLFCLIDGYDTLRILRAYGKLQDQ